MDEYRGKTSSAWFGTSKRVYTRAVAALGASETALFTALVPCVTTLTAIPLLSEWPTQLGWAGVGVVTFGMLVALRPRRAQTMRLLQSTRHC